MVARLTETTPLTSWQDLSGRIAFIGFGEAAAAFVEGWRSFGALKVAAYDIKTDAPSEDVRESKRADYRRLDVDGCARIGDAVGQAALVFSTVTPDQALIAAGNAAPHLKAGALYFDCNSCAPGSKRKAAQLVEAAGGRYVDVAVMAPVGPALHKTALLVSGPNTEAALQVLALLEMSGKPVTGDIGAASSMKMVRSVMMKGLEAVVMECMLAAHKAGVADTVLDSLEATYPGFDWRKRCSYMLERVMTHGVRRAAEMREVALTVEELGLGGEMSRAASVWQERVGSLGLSAADLGGEDVGELAQAILAALEAAQASSDPRQAAE